MPLYRDTRYSFAERAADLVSRMTLEEKAAQLSTSNSPAIPRLGVQNYAYFNEAQHGVAFLGGDTGAGGLFSLAKLFQAPGTSFPTNLSTSLTWDRNLIRREAQAISDEVRGFLDKSLFDTGDNNLGSSPDNYGSLVYFTPTVNLLRDPRWGRSDEPFGEDPFLTGELGSAYVNGFQGQTASGRRTGYLKAIATAKHYALNTNESIPTSRYITNAQTDDATIRDYYTDQFKRIIQQAHVAGLMTSFNAINGTPSAANTYTSSVLAQRTYGHDGYITSDCGAVATTYRTKQPDTFGFAGHDWAPPGWTTNHQNVSARWTNTATGTIVTGQAGGEAFSLRAGTNLNCLGAGSDISGFPGIRQSFGEENRIDYIREAINNGILSEGVIDDALVKVFTLRMATGEFDPPATQPYTKITKDVIQSPAHRALAEQLAEQALVLLKNDPVGTTYKPVLPADPGKLDRVVILGDLAEKAFLGGYAGMPTETVTARQGITDAVKAANPSADVVYAAAGTSTTPATLSDATQAAIRQADLVVMMVGTDDKVNGEGHDRATIAMPGNYTSLLEQVSALGNPNTVLAIQTVGPVSLAGVRDKVPAILFSGPNGQRQGAALANVLFGEALPSGHLTFTWYRDDSQLPDMGNYNLTPDKTGGLGRTYQYFTGTPTYPFGYGLSYTSFQYGYLDVDGDPRGDDDQALRFSFTVATTGSYAGSTVPQLYVSTPQLEQAPAQQLPVKRLRGFARSRVLEPGQRQRFEFTVKLSDLSFWDNQQHRRRVYPGIYLFQLGPDSGTVSQQRTLWIGEEPTPRIQLVTVKPGQVVFAPGETLDLTARNPWLADDTDPAHQPGRDLSVTADRIVEAVRTDETFADLRKANVRYATSDPRVVTVDPHGILTARQPGVATVEVTVDGVTGATPIVVR